LLSAKQNMSHKKRRFKLEKDRRTP